MIRPIVKADIDELKRLEAECFSDPKTVTNFEHELNNDLANFVLYETEGKVMGYLGMWRIVDEVHYGNLAVRPEYRRRGIANKLVAYSIDYAKLNDCRGITLEVRSTNLPAIKLYEKNGFKILGKRLNYYSDSTDALIMWNLLW